MVIDLKMCRFENVPWGFRLIGGADFEVPLTVVKVTEGSIAEQAGMKVGDIIARINDEPASNMTHSDAHHVISKCGNNFFLGVIREEEQSEAENSGEMIQEEQQLRDSVIESHIESHASEEYQAIKEVSSTTVTSEIQIESSQTHEEKVSEEVIAEMMSGEAEILQDHNVIGIFPKAGICQSSEVFRQLNEEATKTRTEMEKEKRKWTTFLQKPDRPIPKNKREQEEQQNTEPYKVRIVKQSKPRVAPDRTPTPPPEPVSEPEVVQKIVLEHNTEQTKVEEQLADPPTDSEVPNLESVSKVDDNIDQEGTEDKSEELTNSEEVKLEGEEIDNLEVKINSEKENNIQPDTAKIQKTEEELLLEKQLEDVQKQLLALSSLPSTIQATLDAVTKQLADLLPSFKLEPQQSKGGTFSSEDRELSQEKASLPEPSGEDCPRAPSEECIEDQENETEEVDVINELAEADSANVDHDIENEQQQIRPPSPTPEEKRLEDEQRKMQEELEYKKQKRKKERSDQREQLKEELEQRLIRDRPPRRPPRAFGPLTPQERPLVLPGGRKWRRPKDAYNDELIAEILSSQAELIVGSTLGVNFLKYQKPEKKIDLEKSEVYKVVHHLEREPRRGIEARPPRVPAEEDIRSRAAPMSCG